jgi:hypothetical protein
VFYAEVIVVSAAQTALAAEGRVASRMGSCSSEARRRAGPDNVLSAAPLQSNTPRRSVPGCQFGELGKKD